MDPEPHVVIPPAPRLEPTPRWVRVRANGRWVADSRRALLLAWYGPGMLPTYLIPPDDVDSGLIDRTAGESPGPFVPHDVVVDGVRISGGALEARGLPAPLSAGEGHWTFTWGGGVTWFEESLEVLVHARDPSKRVDLAPSSRHVQVHLDGVLVADSHRPHALFETLLPTRLYLPPDDVHSEYLEPSSTTSRCPYKGQARYWDASVNGAVHRDIAWAYAEAIPECPRIAGLICFLNERADLTVDGARVPRPVTPWS
ncbi:MAG: DUF427 domain-containing protein [Miltoncostaeaceae bacterium]